MEAQNSIRGDKIPLKTAEIRRLPLSFGSPCVVIPAVAPKVRVTDIQNGEWVFL